MVSLWNFYLNFSVKARLATLCFCYSVCIAATALAAQADSALIKYGAVVLFIVLGGIFGWINIWSINRPIQRAIGYLQTMARGDLSQEITVFRKNEFSRMLLTMRELQGSMREIIAGIQTTAADLSAASDLLRTTSSQIAEGTDHASQESESITTAVDEMASVSLAISHNCQKMAEEASGTGHATESGTETISRMTTIMEAVEQMVSGTMAAVNALGANSERIGDIITAIRDIADQTNLLALNAAIEAARAGEQGRGFAVVADEVRNLAERTTSSTREIQSIIGALQGDVKNVMGLMEQSSDSVRNGTRDMHLSRQAIGAIKEHIAPLIDHVSQVAIAAEEQSATTASITENIHRIALVIRDAAQGAQQTETAAADLAQSAVELQRMVNRFKLSA
ncbi:MULTISPECIES: methyl-accepting chemotaxis protein [Geobacter]|uniref:Chemotaxis protein n=2 Tax=Geobacter TaxID=28231 RepID=A0A0C1TUB2_9BACT|nr:MULTISPECIES: methyl-accepting chemotaxis protein [Geobacter]ANA40889.1 chemotaxis protein [Geobacter anodireducens]KIE42983.1 chemotaxis protein [Geobacter soli]MBE2886986.1 methyl-accepting chemotaxis protein [Geobacter anodireducens]HMN02093.1 methyl-accepting chemotaxis protein [Geobacter anodireducens]